MAHSVPATARPQMIRCLCGFSSYDGFTIMCDKCARWCHAVCFDITARADVPDNWKCWICLPRPGINKNKAVVLQTARQALFETELRERQLKVIALVPSLEVLASVVMDSFSKLSQIKASPEGCKILVNQCLILLLVIYNTPTPRVDRQDEILSFVVFPMHQTCRMHS
ncbi:hypothetical protein BDZ94DRAFT_559724 [Collybia nuda]|uniref:Zinc finger PHD-type domain-containing protein n=1 Tax=Collybia nuda TaxID=64659 RepID=A0A9P5YHF8_9AGAR|nr:hypothetical protein BDZ94DRAFT_559724 [Collybia nuda]